jgi:hypothetical protein
LGARIRPVLRAASFVAIAFGLLASLKLPGIDVPDDQRNAILGTAAAALAFRFSATLLSL